LQNAGERLTYGRGPKRNEVGRVMALKRERGQMRTKMLQKSGGETFIRKHGKHDWLA